MDKATELKRIHDDLKVSIRIAERDGDSLKLSYLKDIKL